MTVSTETRLEGLVDLMTALKDAVAAARAAGLDSTDVILILDLVKTVVEEEA